MSTVKIRYYRIKKGRYAYWEPTPAMEAAGFKRRRLGLDGPEAWAQAERLNAAWDAHRKNPAAGSSMAPRPDSLADVFMRYRAMNDWRIKEDRTKEEWEDVWVVVEPVFGDILVREITAEHCDQFYGRLEQAVADDDTPCSGNGGGAHEFKLPSTEHPTAAVAKCTACGKPAKEAYSLHARHRIIKDFRALLNVAISMGLITTNPSNIIKNKAPKGRTEIWAETEVYALAERAWTEGYRGLAVAIRVAYDTGLQPVDVRLLTPPKLKQDAEGNYFDTKRKKTKKRALGTMSAETQKLLAEYQQGLGVDLTETAPIIRHRSGQPYTKDKLAADFRTIREKVFPGDTRRLQDMRRTSNVEAAVGGARPQDLSAKGGNTIGQSNALFETYTPVQLAAVRQADEARKKGRERLKKKNG